MKQTRAVLAALVSLALLAGCKQHTDLVSSVAYSPDGKLIASGSYDMTIRLWDAAERAYLRTLEGHTHYVLAVSFSPDSKTLLSASGFSEVFLWSVETGKLLQKLQDGKAAGFSNAAFSPDGRLAAGATYAASGDQVFLWDVQTGKQIRAHEGRAFAFSSDSKTLAAGGNDGVHLWDIATGDLTAKIEAAKPYLQKLSLSANGKTLAVLGYEEPIELWNVETGKLMGTLPNSAQAREMALSPDGKTLASYVPYSRIHLWNVDTGELIKKIGDRDMLFDLAFSPDSKTLIAGAHKAVRFYALKND